MDGGLNITANYYPITSAIAIVDPISSNELVVLNDRSQGGSSLKPGVVELMQTRRSNKRDDKGLSEELTEMDKNGQPTKVEATYFVQLFNRNKRKPLQRVI